MDEPTAHEFWTDLLERARTESVCRRRPVAAPFMFDLGEWDARGTADCVDGPPSWILRRLFRALDFDECRPFLFHLDHKLVQARLLDAFAPGSVPKTLGLTPLVREAGGPAAVETLVSERFPSGWILKPARSTGSAERGRIDYSSALAVIAATVTSARSSMPADEEWIVQERVPIACETRVHTVEDRVVSGLVLARRWHSVQPSQLDAAASFVTELLDLLPDSLVGGTMYGFDVGRALDGSHVILEVNATGFHPVFRRGFQCTGYFRNRGGERLFTQLLRHVAVAYGIEFEFPREAPEDWGNALRQYRFARWVRFAWEQLAQQDDEPPA